MKLEGGMKSLVCAQAHVLVHAFKMVDHSEQEAGRWDERLEGGMKFFI